MYLDIVVARFDFVQQGYFNRDIDVENIALDRYHRRNYFMTLKITEGL
jgi:hypothetical protein